MEKQTGLTSTQLEEIFAQIKRTGNDKLGDKIYNAYLPAVKVYARQFHLSQDEVRDIYDEVVSFIYDKILQGIIRPSDFTTCFGKTMMKECIKVQTSHESEEYKFNSNMMAQSYVASQATSVASEGAKVANDEFMAQSLLFAVQFMGNLKHNPELAEQNGLNELKIAMIKDFLGINQEIRRYHVEEIATKYNLTVGRAKAMLASALKAIRHIKEFEPIKAQLH